MLCFFPNYIYESALDILMGSLILMRNNNYIDEASDIPMGEHILINPNSFCSVYEITTYTCTCIASTVHPNHNEMGNGVPYV